MMSQNRDAHSRSATGRETALSPGSDGRGHRQARRRWRGPIAEDRRGCRAVMETAAAAQKSQQAATRPAALTRSAWPFRPEQEAQRHQIPAVPPRSAWPRVGQQGQPPRSSRSERSSVPPPTPPCPTWSGCTMNNAATTALRQVAPVIRAQDDEEQHRVEPWNTTFTRWCAPAFKPKSWQSPCSTPR